MEIMAAVGITALSVGIVVGMTVPSIWNLLRERSDRREYMKNTRMFDDF